MELHPVALLWALGESLPQLFMHLPSTSLSGGWASRVSCGIAAGGKRRRKGIVHPAQAPASGERGLDPPRTDEAARLPTPRVRWVWRQISTNCWRSAGSWAKAWQSGWPGSRWAPWGSDRLPAARSRWACTALRVWEQSSPEGVGVGAERPGGQL